MSDGSNLLLRLPDVQHSSVDESRAKLPALTGVRAIAMLLVYYHHFPSKAPWVGPVVQGMLSEGHVGVTMFFVLSGFLIAYRYDGRIQFRSKDLLGYLWNRFARIYPLYLFLLVPTLLIAREFRLTQWFLQLTLAKGFSDEFKFSGIAQAWSLTAEECFYFSAPVILMIMHSRWRACVLPACYSIAAVLLGVGAICHYHQFFGNPGFVCSYTFFGRAFEFVVGAWIAINLQRCEVLRGVGGKTYLGLAGIAATLAILDSLKTPLYPLGVLNPLGIFVNNWLAPIAIGLFYLGLIQEKTWVQRLLSTPVFQLLGKSSYAFYLIHLGFISDYLVIRLGDASFLLALNLIAVGLFKVIEEPTHRFLRDLSASRARGHQAAAANSIEVTRTPGQIAA